MKMFQSPLAAAKREKLAKSLGVSLGSLEALYVGIGWDFDGTEFASFPARDEHCQVIGITRRYGDGTKKTMKGTSNRGIFAPENWWKPEGPIYVVEGASDVAALTTHGFASLGRPSNIGGAEIIAAYIKRRASGRPVLVCGENDRKPDKVGRSPRCDRTCLGCAWCWPGSFGARRVNGRLRSLGIKSEILMPPIGHKDMREWSVMMGEVLRARA
jgi:hypothetical protein